MILIRHMVPDDVYRGLNESLSSLKDTHLSARETLHFSHERRRRGIFTFVAVAETGRIVGTASLLVEPKLLGGGRYAGYLEDVAVCEEWQGKGIGRLLVNFVKKKAKSLSCYKLILSCKPELVSFYDRLGFHKAEIQMRIDF